MNNYINKLKKLAGGVCFFAASILAHEASAQCDNITVTITATPSTCQSNGTIRVVVTGSDLSNLDMSTAQYAVNPVSGTSYSQGWAQAPGGILSNIPPGTYNVQVRAICSLANPENPYVVKTSGNNATVTSTYVVPNAYIAVSNIRKAFNCTQKYIGRIPVVISGGLAPYTITMTAKPATYTGPTTFTMNSAGTFNVDNLPAGNYTFTVLDNCTYSTTLTATVGTFTADFVPAMIYNYAYMPSSYDADCRKVVIMKNLANTHELYSVYNSEFYEVGYTYNGTAQPTVWQDLPATMNYTLQHDRDVFKANNYYVAVWMRIKGTNCVSKIIDVKAYQSTYFSLSYTPVNCDTVQVSHYLYGTLLYNFFCYPYQFCVVRPTSPYDTIIPWSAPIEHTGNVSTKMPYGSKIVYRDSKGNTYSTTIATSLINNITYSYSYTTSASYPPGPQGYFQTYMYIYASSTTMPAGTRIQYISGPVGAPTPNFSDFTLTANASTVYPYSTTTYTSTGYAQLIPGTYVFRVTLPNGCGTKDISITPTFYRVVTPLSISSLQETCDGGRIYPAGQLGSASGSTQNNNYSTWYSIDVAPSGVTVDKTGVQAGGYLTLPASGTYTIKMTSSQSTNSSNYSAFQTIQYTYEKRPLSLNTNVTSAYVCNGEGTVGHLRVEGINGTGSYTYQQRTQGGGTVIQSNSTGVFNYGSAGETYTIRVIDNTCATYFDQNVSILDLSDTQITYSSGSSNNTFCEGQTLRVNCITLGSTQYSWTGPNGWTSNQQNPSRPNATPDMSGRYTVTVTPEGCSLPMTQYIDVTVSPCIAVVNPHLRSYVK
jgi:hypothetical protein